MYKKIIYLIQCIDIFGMAKQFREVFSFLGFTLLILMHT